MIKYLNNPFYVIDFKIALGPSNYYIGIYNK